MKPMTLKSVTSAKRSKFFQVPSRRRKLQLQTHQQVSSTQLLGLTTQIAELEHRLQEAEEQKHQVELEKDATVQEMNARKSFKVQLHAQLGKL